jgi:hypothetical protein
LSTIKVEYNPGTDTNPDAHVRLFFDRLDDEIMKRLFTDFNPKKALKEGHYFFVLNAPGGLTADTQILESISKNMEAVLNSLMNQRVKNTINIEKFVAMIGVSEHIHCFSKDKGNGRTNLVLASNNDLERIKTYLDEQEIDYRCSHNLREDDDHPRSVRVTIEPEIFQKIDITQLEGLKDIINTAEREFAESTNNPGAH